MITAVVVPKLDKAMEEGTIAQWLRKEGEGVRKGEPLIRIEVDKEFWRGGLLEKKNDAAVRETNRLNQLEVIVKRKIEIIKQLLKKK